MRRTSVIGAFVALALVASACGQKAGVGGSAGLIAAPGTTSESSTAAAAGGEAAAATGSGASAGAAASTSGGSSTGKVGGATTAAAGAAGAAGSATGGTTAAAGPEDRTGITPTEIRIGIHLPKTGAAPCTTCDNGVGVYSQWAGKIPGLGNRTMTMFAEDDKFDAAEGRRVCKKLVEVDKVFILIGGAGVDAIKSCAEYAASKGVPYFSPGVTEGPFRAMANYFAMSETYSQQNVQIAQLIAHQIKKTKVGLVFTDSPLLDETEASMRAQAAKYGLQIVGNTQRLPKDAGKTQTDTAISNLKGAGAEVVYALISPIVFGFLVSSAKQQQYAPAFVGPGLSNGLNLVGAAVCQPPPFPDIRYLSPMVQTDVIDHNDPNYSPAYKKKNGSASQPDDIGILLWGIEKMVRQMMESAGPNLSRQSLMQALSKGKAFATNVYAPVKYAATPHFGASTTTLLTLDCTKVRYLTTKAFAPGL